MRWGIYFKIPHNFFAGGQILTATFGSVVIQYI
jgi:hypothetical protein